MMATYETLFAEASQLPASERAQLIEALWTTLPDDTPMALSDEWLAEIEHRSAAYDASQGECVSWEQVRAAALRRLAAKN